MQLAEILENLSRGYFFSPGDHNECKVLWSFGRNSNCDVDRMVLQNSRWLSQAGACGRNGGSGGGVTFESRCQKVLTYR